MPRPAGFILSGDPTGTYRMGRIRASRDLLACASTNYMQLVQLHVDEALR